ncbi:type I-MYXAN CRISPR-associated Cas8a1/Cmx1 [Coleofasciculus sp. FACHB-129]|uniref:type I-MYXAN CRISPR-associated Cas8a1/Cmx1 n=1 Tax=Cyanophyceae TaxID=3028117 RepID=UPI0016842B34|nr:type I-MYXAN CRISPR-associated Cas8a1/Cmx1 [Coleofasciculus sp. FACHB-129]MBD1897922.1 type I-MYXAN CRISPR-associated Cas8a1/Cmx1 [Coleofasciculus sp. FACHB-129]
MTTTTRPKIYLTLSASDTTIMHRAGMAGLWMTLQQLELHFPTPATRPGNLSWLLTNSSISLDWQGQDFQVLDWLFRQSFQINQKGIISLTGLDSSSMKLSNQIYLHEAIGATFLRHNKFYKSGEKTSESLSINGITGTLKYKKIEWYAHQSFAEKLCGETGELLEDYIQIVSWSYPGATVRHAILDKYNKLEEKVEYALGLLFLPLICQYFILHSHSSEVDTKQPTQYIVVIPEVTNLKIAAQRCWELRRLDYKDFYVTSCGEAALKYYSYDELETFNKSHKNCQALLYTKLNKDSKQRSLTDIQDIEVEIKTILTYKLIDKHLQKNRVFWNGFNWIVKLNLIKGMIADNLVKGVPWWSDFWLTFNQDTLGDLSKQLFFNRKGLRIMIESDKEMEIYSSFIRACHEALRKTYGKIYGRTKEGDVPRFEREYERIRGELGRCYDQQSFNDFLSDFLSRAGLNSALYDQWESILPLLMGQVSWEKARNLVLIALASYKPSPKPSEE